MDTKKVFLWSLYSFGGAFVEIIFILYFSQWLVIDRGLSDAWFNATLVLSSMLVLLSAPIAGSWGDDGGRRLPGLRLGTLLSALCLVIVGVVTVAFPAHALIAAFFFTIGLYFFLFADIFWCALLTDHTQPAYFGRASGWGQFGDWIGEMSALIIILPFVSGAIAFMGAPGRAQAFLPAALFFLVLTLPMLFLYKETPRAGNRRPMLESYKSAIQHFLVLAHTNNLGWFFLAFFFFNDAIITVANNFPIYLARVFGVSDVVKSLLLLAILASAAVGSLLGGWLTDKLGYRTALLSNLGGWIIILPSMALITHFAVLAALSIAMGVWFGSIWVIARSLIAHLAPISALSRAFAYYTLMERFATLIGPVAWSLAIALGPKAHELNYHIALVGMTFFVIIGFILAQKVPSQAEGSLVS